MLQEILTVVKKRSAINRNKAAFFKAHKLAPLQRIIAMCDFVAKSISCKLRDCETRRPRQDLHNPNLNAPPFEFRVRAKKFC